MSDQVNIQSERRRVAAAKDYTTAALVTLALYVLVWIPGAVANVVFLLQAKRDRELLGEDPQGRGCLMALAIAFIVVPFIALAGVLIFLLFGLLLGTIRLWTLE